MTEERQCMCTTPEITIKLNKQGPQGKVGPQGEPGFSPYIGVANDTPSQYILRITNEDGEYLTPNLKANIPLGGNTGDVLIKNSDVNGDCSFKALPYASTTQQGVVYLATTEEALLGDPDYAITGEVLLGVLANKIGNGTITLTQGGVTKGTFTTNQAGDTSISLDDTTYTAGKNIVITGGSIATASNPIFDRAISFTDRNSSEYEVLGIGGTSPNTYIKVGMNYQGLQLYSGTSTITTQRGGNEYTNVDTGNISNYIGNGTITFTQGGVTKGTITTNQLGDTTIDFDAGGGSSYTAGNGIDITNDEISINTSVVATKSDIPDVSNMVTTNTAQTITGSKTFNQLTTNYLSVNTSLNCPQIVSRASDTSMGLVFGSNGGVIINGNKYSSVRKVYLGNQTDFDNIVDDSVNGIVDKNGNAYLTSANISTNAYIQALEARITALETNINGGNANA